MNIIITRPYVIAQYFDWIARIIFSDWLGLEYECKDGDGPDIQLIFKAKQDTANEYTSKTCRTLSVSNDFLIRLTSSASDESLLPDIPLAQWNLQKSILDVELVNDLIPVIYGQPGFILDNSRNGRLNLDVFGSAFFMLSRYEETVLLRSCVAT